MNFDRHFILSSYALLATGFAMLAATRQLDWPATLFFMAVMAAGFLIDTGRLRWSLPRPWANVLAPAYLVVALFEWQVLRVPSVRVVAHFVLVATAMKLLRMKTNRDWLWLHIVSFGLVLMSASLSAGTMFLMLLTVYIFAAISTFAGFEILRSRQSFAEDLPNQTLNVEIWREVNQQRRLLTVSAGRGLFGFSAGALILILLVAVPVFLAVPRVSRGAGRNSLLSTESLSGFSDSVRLGEVAQVKLNPQVVMRVRVRNLRDQQQLLRWRGVTLDQYDGHSWFQSGPEPSPIRPVGDTFRLDDREHLRAFTEQHFFLEPIDSNVVFAAPRPIGIVGLPELSRDLGDGLWTEPHRYNKIEYTAYSDTGVPSDEELAADNARDFRRNIRERYLQLPPEHDKRISQLAADLTQGATTQLEIARRIERHLREQYAYSLQLNPVADGDPVADFLFNARAGHCEYFASAMVLMLRSRQIPARIVNGFQTGEYNATADIYTVRQSDAHSWVEVLFPRSGWVAFDPTPAAGLSSYGDGLMAWMRQYSEALEMFWLEHVVAFDLTRQLSLAYSAQRWLSFYQRNASSQWMDWTTDLARMLEAWRGKPSLAGDAPVAQPKPDTGRSAAFHPIGIGVLLLLLLGAAAFFRRKHWQSWRRGFQRDAEQSAVRFYQEMLRLLERAGHKREPHQTPREFAAQVALPAVQEITQVYQRARFGEEALADEDAARVDGLLQELKKQTGRNAGFFRRPARNSDGKTR